MSSDFLASALRRRPDAQALSDGQGSWSYRELAEAAWAFRGRLNEVIGTADSVGRRAPRPRPLRVALVVDPTPGAIVALHALWGGGALVAPLNPRLKTAELADALNTLEPHAIVTSRDYEGLVAHAAGSARIVFEGGEGGRISGSRPIGAENVIVAVNSPLAEGSEASAPASRRSDGVEKPPPRDGVGRPDVWPLASLWTSGTSGRPHGVLLSGRGLRHSAEATRERLGLGASDQWYASLSIAHVGGLALVFRAAILGSALVVRGGHDLAELSALIDSGSITHASLVPVVLQRLLEHRRDAPPPRALQCLLVGGGPAHPTLVARAIEAGYPIALTYGLTEATSQVATADPSLVRRKPGTVGAPLQGLEVRVAADGEILVRGPTVAVGTIGETELPIDPDGWLCTGDLGELDEEGHLWITGRRSDRIVTGGFTVDPTEVASVLLSHPLVREATVFGLSDPEWGQRVAAVVVVGTDGEGARQGVGPGGDRPELGSTLGRGEVLGELERLCRERLASPKVPRCWLAVEKLPRTPNGKVDREALESLLKEESP